MEIARVFAGYTLGQADLLRRAMGKKIKSEMAAQRETFVAGAVERGVARSRASYIFDLVDKFAGYGFNKAHSVGYALIAYQTAWLKANHPLEFLAASMSLERGNPDKLNVFRGELARLGIPLRPPDINASGVDFTVEYDPAGSAGAGAIRYALSAVRNVGAGAMTDIVAEREKNGRFVDLFDFAARLDPSWLNRRQIETLAHAGGFDAIDPNRRQVADAAELLLRHAVQVSEDRRSGQSNLFGEAVEDIPTPHLPLVDDWPETERLSHEFAALGFYLSAHPLDAYGDGPARLGAVEAATLAADGANRAALAGVVLSKRERAARGGRAVFLHMSDRSGLFEVTVFSECRVEARELLEPGRMLFVEASVQRDDEQLRLTARRVDSLDRRAARRGHGFRVFLAENVELPTLLSVVDRARGRGPDHAPLRLVAPLGGAGEVEIALDGAYLASPAARAALKSVPGVRDVHDLEGLQKR